MPVEALLEELDALIAHAAEVISAEELESLAADARHARRRVGSLGDGLVVALAGGTGSGKSSLLNAIAGEPVTTAGPLRPTTSEAKAWVPSVPEPGIARLLEDLGITDIAYHDRHPHLTILDMPDTDSVVGAHREVFRRLLPRVDAVVWVVDPEKYNDRILHEDYLMPLAPYADQFIFAFNQIDRLDDDGLVAVVGDLAVRLRVDGIHDPLIVEVAADPPGALPVGIDRLLEVFEQRLDAKRLVIGKAAMDAERIAAEIGDRLQLDLPPPEFDERWEATRDRLADVVADLIAGREVEAQAGRSAARAAADRAAGPISALIGAVRQSPVGRLMGARSPDEALDAAVIGWRHRSGREAVYAEIEQFVNDVANDLGGAHGRAVRERLPGGASEHVIETVVERVIVDHPRPEATDPPRWLVLLGALKWLLAAGFVAGAIWLWAQPLRRGEWPWPVILMFGSVAAGLALTRVAEAVGRRRARRAIRRYRLAVAGAVQRELDREIGAPLRTVARDRALLVNQAQEVRSLAAATLAEVMPE